MKSDNQSACRLIPAPRKLSSGPASSSQTLALLRDNTVKTLQTPQKLPVH